ncbi:MAG: hypothetical protein Q4A44_04270 [Bacteroidales bacterium]|nr:hypothetical protein [Bacteroidales bacterium]
MRLDLNVKKLLLLLVALLPLAVLNAQTDLTAITGVYEGEASTSIVKIATGEKTAGVARKMSVEIVGKKGNMATLVLKNYSLRYTFKPIELTDNELFFKNGVWNIEQTSNVQGYFETQDGVYTIQLVIYIPSEQSFVAEDGTLELHFAVENPQTKVLVEHVFKGKKKLPTSITSVLKDEKAGTVVYYDLQGRRVTPTKPGLYIVNGKKVVLP